MGGRCLWEKGTYFGISRCKNLIHCRWACTICYCPEPLRSSSSSMSKVVHWDKQQWGVTVCFISQRLTWVWISQWQRLYTYKCSIWFILCFCARAENKLWGNFFSWCLCWVEVYFSCNGSRSFFLSAQGHRQLRRFVTIRRSPCSRLTAKV